MSDLKKDGATSTLINIREEHWLIHTGKTFIHCDIVDDLDIVTPKKYLIVPGSEMHLTYKFEGSLGLQVQFFEDTTTSNDGTPLTIVNLNRKSSATSRNSLYADPTVTANGTELCHTSSGSTAAAGNAGHVEHANEWILQTGKKYMFVITALANNTILAAEFTWYEL